MSDEWEGEGKRRHWLERQQWSAEALKSMFQMSQEDTHSLYLSLSLFLSYGMGGLCDGIQVEIRIRSGSSTDAEYE
jgi:hypothetical protein